MSDELTSDECQYILTCLAHTRLAYESIQYQSAEIKKAQFDRLSAAQEKLRRIRDRQMRTT